VRPDDDDGDDVDEDDDDVISAVAVIRRVSLHEYPVCTALQ